MEHLTFGDLSKMMVFAVSFIGAIEFLALRMRNYIKGTMKDELEPIKDNQLKHDERLNEIELSSDKNFLVRYLSDVENDNQIDEIEKERFYEVYQRYRQLGGNSYVAHKVEKLQKENKI